MTFFKTASLVLVSTAVFPALDTCDDWGFQGGGYVPLVSEYGPACVASNVVLVCDDPVHEFGTVWAGQALEHEFRVTNIGTELAKVRVVPPGAGSFDLPRVWIEPGQTVGITLFARTNKVRGRFAQTTTLKLESIRDDDMCFGCSGSLDGPRHLERCGPLCPPYEQAWFARVIADRVCR